MFVPTNTHKQVAFSTSNPCFQISCAEQHAKYPWVRVKPSRLPLIHQTSSSLGMKRWKIHNLHRALQKRWKCVSSLRTEQREQLVSQTALGGRSTAVCPGYELKDACSLRSFFYWITLHGTLQCLWHFNEKTTSGFVTVCRWGGKAVAMGV